VKKLFSILFALTLVVSLVVATAAPVLADSREVTPGWTDIDQATAGAAHMAGLKHDGTVVAVGSNSEGQCDVSGWTDIDQIAAGGLHTVGLKSDDTVVAIGSNDDDQCNVNVWTDITQVAAGDSHTVGLQSDGTVVAVGYNDYDQCDVGSWTDIIQVAAGGAHTVGLRSDGTVIAVGNNGDGQCNVGDWTNIDQVAAGRDHTVGVKSEGTVVAVGNNDFGQCGGIVTQTIDGYDIVDGIVEADIRVVVNGKATVTIFKYDSNPHPLSGGGGDLTSLDPLVEEPYEELEDLFRDVRVIDYDPGTEIELRLYYTDAEAKDFEEDTLRLFWWNGYDYVLCSPNEGDNGVNMTDDIISGTPYSGYMWAKIREDTLPSLPLTGDEFGGYGSPTTTGGGGFCFVATAAYGTDTAEGLDILREFRDTVLLPNGLGARLVSLYYRASPPIADLISQNEVLRTVARVGFVDPIVKVLTWTHNLWST